MRRGRYSLVCFLWAACCIGQGIPSPGSSLARGLTEYQAGQFGPAAKDLREAAKADSSNVSARFYLGQALFQQQKYAESAGPYEEALKLNDASAGLSEDQRRVLTDHLATDDEVAGDWTKARVLLAAAIRRDPRYPLNYYNLACAFAEEGNKSEMMAYLSLALENKNHALRGEPLPDPRRDDWLARYARDSDFLRLMRANGFEEGTDPEDE